MRLRLLGLCVLSCLMTVSVAAPAWGGSAPAKTKTQNDPLCTPEEAKIQLDAAARDHLARVARTLRPNQVNKNVIRQDSGFAATYLEVDADRLSTELVGDQQGGMYIGNVIYVVHEYRCTGATQQEALAGPFHKVKSRRIREFTHYSAGKWRL